MSENKCALGLNQDNEKCRGSSCACCGWNPTVDARRREKIRVYGLKALMPKPPEGESAELMNFETALHICKHCDEYRAEDVLPAVERILDMATFNAVPKAVLLDLVRWFSAREGENT